MWIPKRPSRAAAWFGLVLSSMAAPVWGEEARDSGLGQAPAALLLAQNVNGRQEGLERLAPALAFPVAPPAPLGAPRSLDELPSCPPPSHATTSSLELSVDIGAAGPPAQRDDLESLALCAGGPAREPSAPDYDFRLQEGELGGAGVLIMQGVSKQPPAWFAGVRARENVVYRGRSLVYSEPNGPAVAVGNVATRAPSWSAAAQLGGVQISNWPADGEALPEGQFGYSSTLGRLNNMDSASSSGAVDYGASAGSGSLRYGLTPALTLESHFQTAPSLNARGLGTTYVAGSAGTIQVGATQSSFDAANAWRYRFGYNVELANTLKLGFSNEQVGAGFGDLTSYSNGGIGARQSRNTFSAGLPFESLGTLTGTYSGVRENASTSEQRLGLEHSMQLAPRVQFSVGGDRDIVTGDYGMRAKVSMPVDTFFSGKWFQTR